MAGPFVQHDLPHWVAYLQAFGTLFGAVVIASFGGWIALWQMRIAREKLRHDLYERRFGIYKSFDVLIAATVNDEDIQTNLANANVALSHGPFLLDEKLCVFLNDLRQEAIRIQAERTKCLDSNAWPSSEERWNQVAVLGGDASRFLGRQKELISQFMPFLRLRDHSPQERERILRASIEERIAENDIKLKEIADKLDELRSSRPLAEQECRRLLADRKSS